MKSNSGFGFNTVARAQSENIVITDLDSYMKAKQALIHFEDDLFGNLGLDDNEIDEYSDCVDIIKGKIDEFLKNNPEYGI